MVFLASQIRENKLNKSDIRRTLAEYFFMTLGKAVRVVDDLFQMVLEQPLDVTPESDTNDEALRLYSRGQFASARRIWNTHRLNLSPENFRSLLNFKLSRWRLGEMLPSDIIQSIEAEVSHRLLPESLSAQYVEEILFEGGHFPADVWDQSRGVYMSKGFPFVSISSLSAQDRGGCMVALGNAFSFLSPERSASGLSETIYFHNAGNITQSTNKRVWYTRADDIEVTNTHLLQEATFYFGVVLVASFFHIFF
jgi:hypothetical protein